jgi:hypothetical protein
MAVTDLGETEFGFKSSYEETTWKIVDCRLGLKGIDCEDMNWIELAQDITCVHGVNDVMQTEFYTV